MRYDPPTSRRFKVQVLTELKELRTFLPDSIAEKLAETIDNRADELGSITMSALDGKFDAFTEKILALFDSRLPPSAGSTGGGGASGAGGPQSNDGEVPEPKWTTWEWERPAGDGVEHIVSLVPPNYWWQDQQLLPMYLQ